ncbi:MAG: DNA-directed RNA polymerase subunit omega [Ignavibacteriales bacterium CG18_big_fil_WC_8_21_14_2_50_31_20]|nr:MAG: DNA-directed RNA polymerase subunit omega [Ignavibacteriales bacterium CG18_big_fil_WC_8_21_14_2_50_31_20]
MAIQPIDLRKIDGKAENIYEAIIAAGKRARQINDENRLEFNQLISTIIPAAEDEFEERGNPDQERISLQFEKREKPHLRAFNELLDGNLNFRYIEEE